MNIKSKLESNLKSKGFRSALVAVAFGALAFANVAHAALPIEHWTQPSGAQVYLVQSPGIPMVDVQIDFDAGGRREPAAQAGLASLSASMTSKGVVASANGPALDENGLGEAWADLGSSFGGGAGNDRTSYSLRSLTYPDLLAKSVALAARELGEPSYPENVWIRERQRISASIKEANTRPATVAARAFSKAVFGTHPYGYETTEETLARISTADMRKFHDTYLQACGAKVSVVGAVDRAGADAIVAKLLSGLPQTGCKPLPAVPEVQPLTKAIVEKIPFESAQAQVFIGQPGYKRNDPDFFALTVGNYILGGGGFVSRLQNEVREKRGLTYGVYSYFSPGLHAGAFTIGLQTRPDQAEQALKLSTEILADYVKNGPTETELKAAKDNLIGGFPLLIDTNRKLLGNVANIAWNNLPLNYLDVWTAQIDKVTVADIKGAFERKLQPDRMVTVVVGGKQ